MDWTKSIEGGPRVRPYTPVTVLPQRPVHGRLLRPEAVPEVHGLTVGHEPEVTVSVGPDPQTSLGSGPTGDTLSQLPCRTGHPLSWSRDGPSSKSR